MIIANSGRIYTCFSSKRQVNPFRLFQDTLPKTNIRDWNTRVNGQKGIQPDEVKQLFPQPCEPLTFSCRQSSTYSLEQP